tara:strand:- start:7778 stop:7921 length:144 start_codon:yes stop_codon:yes gene_type:complete
MSEKIANSINFLLAEYKRLENKKKNMKITKSEEETLKNLKKFLGKKL